MSTPAPRPLKVLCLHGYRQNGTTFREKTGAFRKALKRHVEFVFMTAPLEVASNDDDKDGGAGWWYSRDDDTYRAQDDTPCVKGYQESLQAIKQFMDSHGPFDGVLGFSQGAAMLGLVCGLLQGGRLPHTFRFAVFVSGYRSRSEPHQELYRERITLPTLHVYGEADQVIPRAMSEELLQYFEAPESLVHPGGHFVPAGAQHKAVYISFLERVRPLCDP